MARRYWPTLPVSSWFCLTRPLERFAAEQKLLAKPDLRADCDLANRAGDLIRKLRKRDPSTLRSILASGTLTPQDISLSLDRAMLVDELQISETDLAPELWKITAPLSLRRRGVEAKLVIGTPSPSPDPMLLQNLRDAHRWTSDLQEGTPMKAIAGHAGYKDVFIRTRGQLAFLSPKIQRAILAGTQPTEFTVNRLMAQPIPLAWEEQERLYGFA